MSDAVPLPEPAAWRSQSPVGGYHFSETRPTGAIEKYPQTPLVTLEDAIVYGAACAAELLAVAKRRADYEASAAVHHSGTWHEAFQHHLTRHKAMRDLIDAVWPDASIRASAMHRPVSGAGSGIRHIARSVAHPNAAPCQIARHGVAELAGTGSSGSPVSPLARAIADRMTRRPSTGRQTVSR